MEHINQIKATQAGTEPCVTFEEANELLYFVLPRRDLVLFLQEHGFVDEYCIPYKAELSADYFKSLNSPEDELEFSKNGKFYFITEKGLKYFFDIAVSKYLNEQIDQKRL